MNIIFLKLLLLYLIKHCNGDNGNEINDTGLTVSKNECLDLCIQTSYCKNYVIKNGTCHFILTLLETLIIDKFRIKRKGGRGGGFGGGSGRGSFGGGRGASSARSNSFFSRGRSGGGGGFVLFSGNQNYDGVKDADFEKERKESILWILIFLWGALILAMFCFKHGKKSKNVLNLPHRYPPASRHHQENLSSLINQEKAYQKFSNPISIPTKPKHSQQNDTLIFEEEMFQEFCKHDSASSEPKIDIYYQKSSSPPPTYEDHLFLDFCQRNSIMPRQVSIVNEIAGNETIQQNHHSFLTFEQRLNRDEASHRF